MYRLKKKHNNIILIVVFVSIVVWLSMLYMGLQKKKKQLEQVTLEKETLQLEATDLDRQLLMERKRWQLKSMADDRFLAEEYPEEAMAIYRQLDSLGFADTSLAEVRKRQLGLRHQRVAQLVSLSEQLQEKGRELRMSKVQSDSLASAIRRMNTEHADRVQEVAYYRRTNKDLSERLTEFEAENKQLLESIKLEAFETPRGDRVFYLGELKDGKAHGFGVALWPSGGFYEGQWKDNMRHGRGIYQWADGERYEGEYVDDRRKGLGTYTWKSKDYFVGQWKDDMRHGEGVLYKPDGKVRVTGRWEKDQLQRKVEAAN